MMPLHPAYDGESVPHQLSGEPPEAIVFVLAQPIRHAMQPMSWELATIRQNMFGEEFLHHHLTRLQLQQKSIMRAASWSSVRKTNFDHLWSKGVGSTKSNPSSSVEPSSSFL